MSRRPRSSRRGHRAARMQSSDSPFVPPPDATVPAPSLQAAAWSTARGILGWPTLDPREEITAWDYDQLWRRARNLYHNTGLIGKCVEDIVSFMGWLMPLPNTEDREWNKLARKAFLRRVNNRRLIDASGQLNWKTMQEWLEKRRTIDGDALCVLTRGIDGGAALRFFAAPQIRNSAELEDPGWIMGVKCDTSGRHTHYSVVDWETGSSALIPAHAAILYRHNPDPSQRRGVTDLIRALVHVQDIMETYGLTKASIKLAASIGLVETQQPGDKKTGAASALGIKAPKTPQGQDAAPVQIVPGGGSLVTLQPGRDLKVVADPRPSPQVVEFVKQLVAEVAYGIGLEPGILFALLGMGSAEVRFFIGKLRRWIEKRLTHREEWANTVYQYVIAGEIASGRLRPCEDPYWTDCHWVPTRDITIDVGREGGLAINLIREGLGSPNSWTLATEGKTVEEIQEELAYSLQTRADIAAKYNIDPAALTPGMAGAPTQPQEKSPSSQPIDEEEDDDEKKDRK